MLSVFMYSALISTLVSSIIVFVVFHFLAHLLSQSSAPSKWSLFNGYQLCSSLAHTANANVPVMFWHLMVGFAVKLTTIGWQIRMRMGCNGMELKYFLVFENDDTEKSLQVVRLGVWLYSCNTATNNKFKFPFVSSLKQKKIFLKSISYSNNDINKAITML